MADMAPPPTEITRPPVRHRITGNLAATMLVVAAVLFAGYRSLPPPVAVVSPSPSLALVTAQPSGTSVPSDLLEFPATADAYVFAGRPALNYGASTELRVDADPATLTYLLFDVSGIHAQVLSVRLRISTLGRLIQGFQVRAAAADWGESAITYATRPAENGDIVGTSGLIADAASVEVSLTPVISGDGRYSYLLFTTSTTALTFASREAGAGTAPTLLVEVAKSPAG